MKRNIVLLFVCLVAPMLVQAQKENKTTLNIVYIGNSITQGALLSHPETEAPPAQTSAWLRQRPGIAAVEYANQGVSGSTTVDFLPASHTLFPKVQQAAEALSQKQPKATLVFSLMLGTNDSAVKGPNGSPVSAVQYYTNVKVIVDELINLYPNSRVVIHRPLWYSPNTYNSAIYLTEGLRRIESYYPQLQTLVQQYAQSHPRHVFLGDTEAFEALKSNYQALFTPETDGNAGTFYLHPNLQGAALLSEYWGKAIEQALDR
ncbi:MAG: GDSL-type esterase/lipase family protein [Bacteroides sp.]